MKRPSAGGPSWGQHRGDVPAATCRAAWCRLELVIRHYMVQRSRPCCECLQALLHVALEQLDTPRHVAESEVLAMHRLSVLLLMCLMLMSTVPL